ncbi:MAG TPA: carboxymuconolactone decarboxylase family protein [Anaeromyxobacter sp.]|jgi:alkylhydroperoxidase/carboxymuconolactone decarboxylase family protein YurZ|nr:carboxymuconolactone decarboxylase family protein [Anaeromyxobacter sp.]
MAKKLPDHFVRFTEKYPDIAKAFDEFGRKVHETGPLTERERRLVKLGIAIGVSTEGGVHSAVRNALTAGCTREDLEHVVRLSFTTIGWPRAQAALTWVLDVLEDEG